MSLLRCFIPLAVALACIGQAGTVLAQTRVVVLGFSGPRAGAARSALVRAIEDQVELVEASEWRDAAERIGVRGRSSRTYARIAREVGVTAIVTGSVSRARRRRFALSIAVRQGSNGTIVGRASRAMRTLGAVGGAAASRSGRVLELIAEAEAPTAGGGEDDGGGDEGGDEGATMDWSLEGGGEEAAGGGEGGGGRTRGSEGGGTAEALYVPEGADESPITGQAVDTEGVGGEGGGSSSRRRPRGGGGSSVLTAGASGGWLDIGIEMTAAARTFTLSINSAIDTLGRPGAKVESGVFPEFGARLSAHPLTLLGSEWWTGLGLEATFHHHLTLAIFRDAGDGQPPAEIEAGEYSYSVGLDYRVVLGSPTVGVTIWARAGYGRFAFLMGPVNNDLVPPFEYDFIYLGLAAYIPVTTTYIGIDLSAGYNGVLGIGKEAAATFNEQHALPSSNGFEILAGLSGQIWGGLRWRVAFEMLGFVTTHQGVGRGWGSDPTTVQGVDGGQGIETVAPTVDLFWRIVPQLVYRFGGGGGTVASGGGDSDDDDDGGGDSAPAGDWFEDAPEEPEEPEETGDDEGGSAEEVDDEGWMTTD